MHIAIALIVNNRAQRVTATLITQTLQDHRSRKTLEEPGWPILLHCSDDENAKVFTGSVQQQQRWAPALRRKWPVTHSWVLATNLPAHRPFLQTDPPAKDALRHIDNVYREHFFLPLRSLCFYIQALFAPPCKNHIWSRVTFIPFYGFEAKQTQTQIHATSMQPFRM